MFKVLEVDFKSKKHPIYMEVDLMLFTFKVSLEPVADGGGRGGLSQENFFDDFVVLGNGERIAFFFFF